MTYINAFIIKNRKSNKFLGDYFLLLRKALINTMKCVIFIMNRRANMEYLKKLIQQISSRRFMFTILNILGLSIIIYILYATQAVWMSWVHMVLKIIEPFFVGFTIAYVFSPFVSYLEKHHI